MALPTPEEVAAWSKDERAQVARLLDARVTRPVPPTRARGRRWLVLGVTALGAVVLLPWIAFLSVTLPLTSSGGAWRTAWVGFDFALALALGATAWLVWHRRDLAMLGIAATATLLICDGWFDVCLSWGSSERWSAPVLAVFVELPVSVLLISASLTLVRRTAAVVQELRGLGAEPAALWRQALVMVPPPGRTRPAAPAAPGQRPRDDTFRSGRP